ncbi:Protein of uncharacterised function (DUF2803) [Legionella wadsworthii]|uniref:Protein of uncharacterized function (DUF2803) n=1 Tax=Legionella wadsworthii TaxID=28088 RepID=A0A378LT08_9GAMM|nr:CsiV family protein [Legionella wadsworthii]STY28972.1 Protein of uncharacterised function (DUF2803) [Legionella wadsworthii]
MERLITIILGILYSCLTFAQPSYQIDLILFAHPNANTGKTIDSPLLPMSTHVISLKMDGDKSGKPYHLLPPSSSSLRDEYYLLSRKSPYQVLGHYSWKQPSNNQTSVALPLAEQHGWQMQGTVNVKQSTYYSFEAELQVSSPSNPQSSFIISQKQRLKSDVVYYLDNALVGMLVKIHKVG